MGTQSSEAPGDRTHTSHAPLVMGDAPETPSDVSKQPAGQSCKGRCWTWAFVHRWALGPSCSGDREQPKDSEA